MSYFRFFSPHTFQCEHMVSCELAMNSEMACKANRKLALKKSTWESSLTFCLSPGINCLMGMVFLVVLSTLGKLIMEKQDNYDNVPCVLPLGKYLIDRIYLSKVSVEV